MTVRSCEECWRGFRQADVRQTTEAFTAQTAEYCGNSAVAVLQGRQHFLHGAEAGFHGLAVQ